jgi:rod shape-determining protein MreD
MATKIIINSFLIIALAVTQFSFISGLPHGFNNLNLILVILVYILSRFGGIDFAIWWAIGLGFLLDILSFSYFGTYLVSLSLTIVIADFLLKNFFTNRSLYSFLALTGLTTIIYEFFLNGIYHVISLIDNKSAIISSNFWSAKLVELGLNLVATLILFYLVHSISKRLKPVFLIKERK